jgi:hypothetical protein
LYFLHTVSRSCNSQVYCLSTTTHRTLWKAGPEYTVVRVMTEEEKRTGGKGEIEGKRDGNKSEE